MCIDENKPRFMLSDYSATREANQAWVELLIQLFWLFNSI